MKFFLLLSYIYLQYSVVLTIVVKSKINSRTDLLFKDRYYTTLTISTCIVHRKYKMVGKSSHRKTVSQHTTDPAHKLINILNFNLQTVFFLLFAFRFYPARIKVKIKIKKRYNFSHQLLLLYRILKKVFRSFMLIHLFLSITIKYRVNLHSSKIWEVSSFCLLISGSVELDKLA